MKKLLIIGGAIVAVFILIVVLSNKADETKMKDNPYGTDKLSKSTIDLIGNENYSNIVKPDDLFKKIEAGESVTVYYFHPECQFCMQMTPVMMPIAKEMGADVLQYNMMEFGDLVGKGTDYEILSWPQLVHYENGEKVGSIAGYDNLNKEESEKTIRAFFTEFEGK
ncbi:thioredoxin family protein [Sporosarcina sp. E16_8]|uniref:thioredoxin family protein n=1 Tax=Sporosarcina sp. E16_8 TaxID=2789295 RepID=UPI001A92DB26|nr:thioredoxin family protein [Sporosarcina sp. E16_8]MBO0589214.1 thioredoxin family protein [Sporosarcina sp. E16_8]